ncbi:hypothetical protein E4634_08490 [Mangrovimicrobium sediminis]|uniref:DUF6268 domain-containing protein n=1 Tax=Mangrovimicrobium sediminis TaxID=2562682 RepID=A0A4Z0M4R9_9GAMM|nr:hypothetical protein E4634_08490 [Haliea sp. SAOS-164]
MAGAVSASSDEEGAGYIRSTIEAFQQSDIRFQRGITNAPFPPIAFLSATTYGDVEVSTTDGQELEYNVDRYSQMAGIPFLLGKRDALLVGEYVSWSRFDVSAGASEEFDVTSIGLPVGWFRQVNPDWQAAAFVMPLGHDSSLEGSGWTWQYLGGAFTRYVQNEQLWWAFGFYADVGFGDDFYIPYIGASWAIDERWTLSAMMPWPAIIYAPNRRWMLRLGAAPSGASWSLDLDRDDVAVNFDAWDLGLDVEYRVAGNVWLGARTGVGGLRGLRLEGSAVEEPDVDFSANYFLNVTLNYRPALD